LNSIKLDQLQLIQNSINRSSISSMRSDPRQPEVRKLALPGDSAC
jgi:hypothetical protein